MTILKLNELKTYLVGKPNPLLSVDEQRRKELLILIISFTIFVIYIDLFNNLFVTSRDEGDLAPLEMFIGSLPMILFYLFARIKYSRFLEFLVPIFSNVIILILIWTNEDSERLFIYLFIPILIVIVFFKTWHALALLGLNIVIPIILDKFVDPDKFHLNLLFNQIIPFLAIATLLVIVLNYHRNLIYKDNLRIIKQNHEQLMQIQKKEIIGKLAGNVAHDFNHLLTIILGHTEILDRSIDPKNQLQSSLEEIQNAVGKAKILIDQLFSFARKSQKQVSQFYLNQILETYEKMFSKIIDTNIEFKVEYLTDDIIIKGDPHLFGQVILNLIINAQDAIGSDGKISLIANQTSESDKIKEMFPKQDVIVIKVIDNGIGINQSILPMIFDSFFTTKETGTGLGLAISKEIIEQEFKGFIGVESSSQVGTEVKIYLPYTQD
ncbi:MAG: sensor histidine kinase [Candidatus Kariarchaeaceae archaeon]